ncbi:MAG TPA: hypothetical protein VN655_06285 [Pseudolabrys sp.]|nr:hypothetical protein [Pseudolabrys sp.]
MPTSLPIALPSRARHAPRQAGPLAAACVAIGAAAAGLIVLTGLICGDGAGALLIAVMTSILIGVLLNAARP